MGQIFKATVYDIENRTCYSEDADKFHANCYSFSGTVCSVHYLLRQSAYHVMWCGDYIVLNDAVTEFLSEEKLLGISINESLESFQRHNKNLSEKPYYEGIKFIGENQDSWNRIDVSEEAADYFDLKNTETVKYDGYLINHTKKQAINLKDYYEQSVSITREEEEYVIDLIPSLTETGGGTLMALFDGCSAETTEKLIGAWCGDLLQIVEQLPEGFAEISCSFASIWERADYCQKAFGLDDEQFILKNDRKERFEATALSFFLKRGKLYNIKVERHDQKISFKPIPR